MKKQMSYDIWHYVIFKFTSAIAVWTFCTSVENIQRIRKSCFIGDISWWQYVFIVFVVMGIWEAISHGLNKRIYCNR